jgi:hypothetical protein
VALLHPVEDWAVVQMAVASPNLQSKKGKLKKVCVNLGERRFGCGYSHTRKVIL